MSHECPASVEEILQDVSNASSLISFQFCNHKATNLKGIKNYKNLTQLDVSGNLLQKADLEILELKYIKKLNLSNNNIHQFWRLPNSLELLSISHNRINSLANIAGCLPNLVVLDISHNSLDSLENISLMTKLRILQASNNRIVDLSHFRKFKDSGNLKELDLSSNHLMDVNSLRDLKGQVKLELLNLRANSLEKEKNFSRKAQECLSGLRFFKDERIFASSKRNLKSSVLLTSAREGKDGSGLWHSCVEFEEVHSDTTRSLESTLNSKLGEVLQSLKSSQTVTPKVEDEKRPENRQNSITSHTSITEMDSANNNNPSQFQPTINNNPKRPKLPSLQLGSLKDSKLSGLMESMVNRPVLFSSQPLPPNKTPQILTIDEVVAQEESKRSTLRKEESKKDFNKLQRLKGDQLAGIDEKKESINYFEYEESDSDSDSDIMPGPPPKGPPSFLKDKLKLNIPGQKLIKLKQTSEERNQESPLQNSESQCKSFSKKISIVKTTDFEVDPLESQKSNPPKSSKRIVRPEEIRFKQNGFATFNKPEGYPHDEVNVDEVLMPSRFVYSSTPTLHSEEESPAMATMSMTQILFDLQKRNSYLHSQLETRRQNFKEEGRSFDFAEQQKSFDIPAHQYEELSFDGGVGLNHEAASFCHLQEAAYIQERDSLIQFNEMLQESLEKLRRKWESKKELLKYYERTSAQKALKIEKLEGSLSNFMLEFRDFAKSILKERYSKRFGNIASQIYKLKESGFSQIPNQFKELFCELVKSFDQNLSQREKLEVVNDELTWRIRQNQQKIETFSKEEARLEMVIEDLSSKLTINNVGGSKSNSENPRQKAKIAELEKNLEKQTKLKDTYLKDMQDIRLKNRKEKKQLEERMKELEAENQRLKSVQIASQQNEESKSTCSVKQDRNQTIVSSRMTPSEIRRGSYLANDKQVQIQKLTQLLKEKETTLSELQLQYKTSQEEMKQKINNLEEKLAKKSNILRLQPSHFRRKSDCLGHNLGLVESQNSFLGHNRSSFDEKYSRLIEQPSHNFQFYPQLEEKNQNFKESEKQNKVRSEQNSGRLAKEQMHSGRYFESKRNPHLMMSITPRNWFGNEEPRVACSSSQVNQTTPDDHLGRTSLINMKRDQFNQSFNIDSSDQTMQLATPCRTQADYKTYLKNAPGLLANNSMYYPSPLSIQHSTPGVNGVFSRGYFTTDSEKQFFRDDGSRGRKGATKFMNKKISNYIDALKHKNDHLKEKLSTSIEQRKKLKEQLTSCNIVIKNLAATGNVRPKSSGLKRTYDGNTSFRRMTLPRESTKTLPH